MKCSGPHLLTPLYLKLDPATRWPEEEKAFYLLSRDGLFLCRNTPFFQSCVPVRHFPSELAGQMPFLRLSYPRIPRRLIERVIGFFDIIYARHASEAAVLIAWNRQSHAVEIIVPDQVGLVGASWHGTAYPLELEYEVPPLPPHLVLLGDIHSHGDGPAYASGTDRSDEVHRPGIHAVIGRILDEPPQFHCEATADGFRFTVHDLNSILEGYHRRRVNEVPSEWIEKVTVKPWKSKWSSESGCNQASGSNRSSTASPSGNSVHSGSPNDALEASAPKPTDDPAGPLPCPAAIPSLPAPLAGNVDGRPAANSPAAEDPTHPPTSARPGDTPHAP